MREPEFIGERTQRSLFAAGSHERERRLREAVLHETKRAQRAGDVVESLEIAGRQQARAQRVPEAERKSGRIGAVVFDFGTPMASD